MFRRRRDPAAVRAGRAERAVRAEWAGRADSVSDALVLDGVSREYRPGAVALHPVDLTVPRGRFVAVMGPSGCGKSTLLQCAAGLDRPTAGTVRVAGTDLSALKEDELTRLRRERVGFVFQAHNLVPSLSVAENVALPLLLGGAAPDEPTPRGATTATTAATVATAATAGPGGAGDGVMGLAAAGLAAVGLADRGADRPSELSGGQRQRVAIARALVTTPDIVFADEPTGALDPGTAHDVLALLRRAVDRDGRTVVMVTHDPAAAAWADEALFLRRGRVVGRQERPRADDVRRVLVDMGREGRRAA